MILPSIKIDTSILIREVHLLIVLQTSAGGPRISFSGHFFQPLQFNDDGSVQDLDCAAGAEFDVPITLGDGTPDSGALTTATDSSPRFADVSLCL